MVYRSQLTRTGMAKQIDTYENQCRKEDLAPFHIKVGFSDTEKISTNEIRTHATTLSFPLGKRVEKLDQ